MWGGGGGWLVSCTTWPPASSAWPSRPPVSFGDSSASPPPPVSSEPVQRHQTGIGAGAVVGVERPADPPSGGGPDEAPDKEFAGQHQRQEHQRASSERAHHRQPAQAPPGRRHHAGASPNSLPSGSWTQITTADRLYVAFQSILAILDSMSIELLSECHRRSLKKISSLPDSSEEIDDTILT